MTNALYYGDNLSVLREHVAADSVDLVYLDPPFNSNATYNILFKSPAGAADGSGSRGGRLLRLRRRAVPAPPDRHPGRTVPRQAPARPLGGHERHLPHGGAGGNRQAAHPGPVIVFGASRRLHGASIREILMEDLAYMRKILDSINRDMRMAIAIHQIYVKSAHDDNIISKYNNSHAANAFNVVRDNLFYSEILALMRIWDYGKDAFSIPNIIKRLRKSEVRDAIIGRRRKANLGLQSDPGLRAKYRDDPAVLESLRLRSEEDAVAAADDARVEIDGCLKDVDRITETPGYKSLRNFRDKVVAHTLSITNSEKTAMKKGEPIRNLKYGDESILLRDTISGVTRLNPIVDDLHVFFDNTERIWEKYSDDFWRKVSPPNP